MSRKTHCMKFELGYYYSKASTIHSIDTNNLKHNKSYISLYSWYGPGHSLIQVYVYWSPVLPVRPLTNGSIGMSSSTSTSLRESIRHPLVLVPELDPTDIVTPRSTYISSALPRHASPFSFHASVRVSRVWPPESCAGDLPKAILGTEAKRPEPESWNLM